MKKLLILTLLTICISVGQFFTTVELYAQTTEDEFASDNQEVGLDIEEYLEEADSLNNDECLEDEDKCLEEKKDEVLDDEAQSPIEIENEDEEALDSDEVLDDEAQSSIEVENEDEEALDSDEVLDDEAQSSIEVESEDEEALDSDEVLDDEAQSSIEVESEDEEALDSDEVLDDEAQSLIEVESEDEEALDSNEVLDDEAQSSTEIEVESEDEEALDSDEVLDDEAQSSSEIEVESEDEEALDSDEVLDDEAQSSIEVESEDEEALDSDEVLGDEVQSSTEVESEDEEALDSDEVLGDEAQSSIEVESEDEEALDSDEVLGDEAQSSTEVESEDEEALDSNEVLDDEAQSSIEVESEDEEALDSDEVLDDEAQSSIEEEDSPTNQDNLELSSEESNTIDEAVADVVEEQVIEFKTYDTTNVKELSQEFLDEFFANKNFIKVGVDGSMLSFQDKNWLPNGSEEDGTQWSCALDKGGFLWEIKKDEGIHQKDIKYRWGGKTTILRQFESKETGEYHPDWDQLVDASNEEQLCGYSDWRVPSIEELPVLLTEEKHKNLHIDITIFPNAQAWYWTASPYATYASFASTVYFNMGISSYYFRKSFNHVRLVRKDIED